MKLRVERETNFRSIDASQFMFVTLSTTQFSQKLPQGNIFLCDADGREIRGYKLMNGENIRKLDIESRLLGVVKVIELIDIELGLGGTDGNDCYG